MHDSANIQRCSINRLVQGGFRAIASQAGLLRKLHPTTRANSGPQFPDRAPRGNCGPESAPETGRGFPKGRISRPPLVKIIRFPPLYAEHPRSVPECRHNRNVPSCRQHFTATAKTRAGNRIHLRGFSGRSQRYVTEAHVSYGLPNGTGTRCLSRLTKR